LLNIAKPEGNERQRTSMNINERLSPVWRRSRSMPFVDGADDR
jgi:hypothetical protein